MTPRAWYLAGLAATGALLVGPPPPAGMAARAVRAAGGPPVLARAAGGPALPGPPPGAGSEFPAAPRPGVTPPSAPLGPPARIPASVSTPGLLNGTIVAAAGALRIAVACHRPGHATLTAGAISRGVLARAAYGCSRGRGLVRAALSTPQARRLRALGETLASIILSDGHASVRLSLALQSRSRGPRYWSDGGLQCTVLGDDEPYLVDPDFQVTPAVTIDVRPWIAWYTATGGWQWLGTRGVRSSRWYRFTAGPAGVVQWRTPRGAVHPWTWAPITVGPGHGTVAIGVFEVIYRYPHPLYTWAYAHSSVTMSPLGTYCAYS